MVASGLIGDIIHLPNQDMIGVTMRLYYTAITRGRSCCCRRRWRETGERWFGVLWMQVSPVTWDSGLIAQSLSLISLAQLQAKFCEIDGDDERQT